MPDARTMGLWPLSFGQSIGMSDLAELKKDTDSWLSEACRRNQAYVIVAPSVDVLLNRADFPAESPADATIAILQSVSNRFGFDVVNATRKPKLAHLFLQAGEECIYWGAYRMVPGKNGAYVFFANRMPEVAGFAETLVWEALREFVDLALDAPDATFIAYFTDDRDAATVEHRRWQNHLAAWLRANGIAPRDYRSNRAYVDIAWELTNERRFVCEVKTATLANERSQVFLGMGQAQSYALEFEAQPVLFLGSKPATFERVKWPAMLGVFVLWPEALDLVRPHDLDGTEPSDLLKQLL